MYSDNDWAAVILLEEIGAFSWISNVYYNFNYYIIKIIILIKCKCKKKSSITVHVLKRESARDGGGIQHNSGEAFILLHRQF